MLYRQKFISVTWTFIKWTAEGRHIIHLSSFLNFASQDITAAHSRYDERMPLNVGNLWFWDFSHIIRFEVRNIDSRLQATNFLTTYYYEYQYLIPFVISLSLERSEYGRQTSFYRKMNSSSSKFHRLLRIIQNRHILPLLVTFLVKELLSRKLLTVYNL